MKQYPHFMFVKKVSESVQDADGNWTSQTAFWEFISICREQTNGKGSVINSQDGKAITFNSVVHLPLSDKILKEGTEILVSNTNNTNEVRIQKQLLKFDKGQLHNRVWL